MARFLTISDFARLAGTTRQTIYTAIAEGRIKKIKKGIDPTHPDNVHFLEQIRESKKAGGMGSRSGKVTHPRPPMIHQNPAQTPESPKVENGVQKVEKPSEPTIEEIDELDFSNAEIVATINTLSKTSADKIKIVEQIRELQLKREIKRQEMIPRTLVQEFLSKMYLVDKNEFLQLSEKLAPEIAAICGVTSQAKVLEIAKIIEKETYKTLRHIKRSMEEFLKDIKSELKIGSSEVHTDGS